MNYPAVASRLFQFTSGPESHRFYACERHQGKLSSEPPSSVFLRFIHEKDRQTQYHDVEDEIECDYCRGEDGP